MKIWVVAACALFGDSIVSSGAVAAPGFDCSGALKYAEMSVCRDSYLSSLDIYLNTLYSQYKKITFSPAALKSDQLEWLKLRNACGTSDCIRDAYDRRIQQLISEAKLVEPTFQALATADVLRLFQKEADAYEPISIAEMRTAQRSGTLFPVSFFQAGEAELTSFKRSGTNEYRFDYSYKALYGKLKPILVRGYFIVDSEVNIENVQIIDNLLLARQEDAIVKASAPDKENDLEVINSVLVELKTQGVEVTGGFLRLFEQVPSEVILGTGKIACKNSQGRLVQINGSIFSDQISCPHGNEIINSYAGNDTIDASWGNEIVATGEGNDHVDGSWGDELIYPGPGNDTVESSHGALTLMYGDNWGEDVVTGRCDLIIFARSVRPIDVEFAGGIITNKKNRGRVKVVGSPTGCKRHHFSEVEFK